MNRRRTRAIVLGVITILALGGYAPSRAVAADKVRVQLKWVTQAPPRLR